MAHPDDIVRKAAGLDPAGRTALAASAVQRVAPVFLAMAGQDRDEDTRLYRHALDLLWQAATGCADTAALSAADERLQDLPELRRGAEADEFQEYVENLGVGLFHEEEPGGVQDFVLDAVAALYHGLRTALGSERDLRDCLERVYGSAGFLDARLEDTAETTARAEIGYQEADLADLLHPRARPQVTEYLRRRSAQLADTFLARVRTAS